MVSALIAGGTASLGESVLELTTDDQKLDKGLSDAEKKAKRWGRVAAVAVAAGAIGFTAFAAGAVSATSTAEEAANASAQVFGEASEIITAFGEDSARSVGLSSAAVDAYAASLGDVFKATGLTRQETAGLSLDMLKLAADLASIKNLDIPEVLTGIQSGLLGEAEPARRLGVVFNATTVEAKALELGLGDVHGELTEGEKILARYQIFLDQTSDSQGDFQRTAGGAANQARILDAQFEELQINTGQLLLPAFTLLLTGINDVTGAFIAMDPATQQAVLAMAGMATVGPAAALAYTRLGGAAGSATTAVRALNFAMLTSPAAIAGMVAALAVGVVIYDRLRDSAREARLEQEKQAEIADLLANKTDAQIRADIASLEARREQLEIDAAKARAAIDETRFATLEQVRAWAAAEDAVDAVDAKIETLNGALAESRTRANQAAVAQERAGVTAEGMGDSLADAAEDASDLTRELSGLSSQTLATALATQLLDSNLDDGDFMLQFEAFADQLSQLLAREAEVENLANALLSFNEIAEDAGEETKELTGAVEDQADAAKDTERALRDEIRARNELLGLQQGANRTLLDRARSNITDLQNAAIRADPSQLTDDFWAALAEQQRLARVASERLAAPTPGAPQFIPGAPDFVNLPALQAADFATAPTETLFNYGTINHNHFYGDAAGDELPTEGDLAATA